MTDFTNIKFILKDNTTWIAAKQKKDYKNKCTLFNNDTNNFFHFYLTEPTTQIWFV